MFDPRFNGEPLVIGELGILTVKPFPRLPPSPEELVRLALPLGDLDCDWGHFSKWWWWALTARRLTCTGMGTTILEPELEFCPPELCRLVGPAPPLVSPALTLFHLARRFWNQIFTWTSESLSACAMWERSVRLRYFFAWNSRSSSRSCSEVKAVLRRRALLELPAVLVADEPWPILPASFRPLSSSLSAETRPLSDPAKLISYYYLRWLIIYRLYTVRVHWKS